ncbi:MAG TPA: MBL fold metallo-hydrolase, partial [Micavibrio sp.]|nr:MBL fold metallo-hydrolase [Micavibrio sp.]
MDRRHFIVGSAMVAAGAALASSLGLSKARAEAPQGTKQAPGYYRTKVGSIELVALSDGGMTLGDELMLKTDAETLAAAREKNFIKAGKEFPAYVNGYVVNTGKKVTLVDTGAKGYAVTLGNLLSNLNDSGLSSEQVDEIVLTHAHPDHTNGLLDDKGGRAFKRARLRLSEEELNYWFSDEKMAAFPDKNVMFDLAHKNIGPYKDAGQVETFKLGADLGGGIHSLALPGHTPGHTGLRISDGSEQFLIWADLIHVPAVQFEHPEISIAFDTDPDMAKATRTKVLAEAAADRLRVAGMHLIFPGIGHVVKSGDGYAFAPQAWETAV